MSELKMFLNTSEKEFPPPPTIHKELIKKKRRKKQQLKTRDSNLPLLALKARFRIFDQRATTPSDLGNRQIPQFPDY